ncbi:hypothetical protein Q9251_02885 [Alkalihalobacillus macyae]|uniref:hypothetical protein n=1 Tax=Guptibacillus hwajinpoensis TaxID=208199 RepID=UPI00273AB3D4|nr:hypothetical protein [Alkalihalobacillus macyae]MDP4549820.1 hypothetical protein [Alkalihalobacillus macyae]
MEYTAELERYLGVLRGSPFIKSTELIAGGNDLHIIYYSNYADYLADNKDTNHSEKDFNNYFGSGDAIAKILVGEPVRLLREFKDLENVTLEFGNPTQDDNKHVHVSRYILNKYLGYKVEGLSVEDGSWREKFSNVYLYDKSKREAFLEQFGCEMK